MAGLGRRTFAAGEVLTAGNVMGYLQDQAVMNFAGTAARGSAIGTAVSEGMVSYLKDTNAVEVYDGSAWKRVYPAVDVPTAGQIIQVVQVTKTDTFSTTSGTFTTVTGLSASITPRSSSNKILILGQISYSMGLSSANDYGHFKITRAGTDIYIGNAASSQIRAVFGGNAPLDYVLQSSPINYLDSPSTTSPVTYQLETRRGRTGNTAYINRSAADVSAEFDTRGASSITLLEVVG